MNQLDLIKSSIKSIPDYPKAGIIFRDITSLLEVPTAFKPPLMPSLQNLKTKVLLKLSAQNLAGLFLVPLLH